MAQSLATAAEIIAFAAANGLTYTTELIEAWIPYASSMTNVAAWGDDASLAHTLRTLHYATQAQAGPLGISGALTSEANGPASRSFAAGALASPLETTLWGKMLADLIRMNARPGIVANTDIRQT